jgi:hypothetical protein
MQGRSIISTIITAARAGSSDVALSKVYGAAIDFSTDVLRSSEVNPSGAYSVPAGTTLILDSSVELDSLDVMNGGRVLWDTGIDDLTLTTGYVVVGNGGAFHIGSEAAPMQNRATIRIKDGLAAANGWKRTFGSLWGGELHLFGKPVQKTWTLLAESVQAGSSTVLVEGLPDELGWLEGDRIAIAPTQKMARGHGESFNITTMAGTSNGQTLIGLSAPVAEVHLGEKQEIGGKIAELQAEVVHLSRQILITGDGGIQTISVGAGVVKMQYTRVERCGQPGNIGKYCLHMHVKGQCPQCIFKGNAVEHGTQRGIVVHGTHYSTVEQNIVYDVKGAYLYIEDGNEMGNLIKENVLICPHPGGGCSTGGTDNNIADGSGHAGLWALSPNNDFVGNRISNMIEGFFLGVQNSPFGKNGGMAFNKVCTMHTPFGRFERNVNHNNRRFGFYAVSLWPRNIIYDENGFVDVDHVAYSHCHHLGDAMQKLRCACGIGQQGSVFADAFGPDGTDRGQNPAAKIVDHLDWGNDLVGQYHSGDIMYLGQISVNNAHGMYWKTSKNFADPSAVHIKNSLFANDAAFTSVDPSYQQAAGWLATTAGGHGTFVIQDTTFVGTASDALKIGKDCGKDGMGGLCGTEVSLVNVDFSQVRGSWVMLGHEGSYETIVVTVPVPSTTTTTQGPTKAPTTTATTTMPVFESTHQCSFSGQSGLCVEASRCPQNYMQDPSVNCGSDTKTCCITNLGGGAPTSQTGGADASRESPLGGFTSLVTNAMSHIINDPRASCIRVGGWAGSIGGDVYGCAAALRRLYVWNARGTINIVDTATGQRCPMYPHSAAEGGFGNVVVVRVGGEYRLEGLVFTDDITIEFSDPAFGQGPAGIFPTEPEEVTLYMEGEFQTSPCIARSSDDRSFITPVGPKRSGYGSCRHRDVPGSRPTTKPTSPSSADSTMQPTSQTPSPTLMATIVSPPAAQLCSPEDSDRYNPNRQGCCSGLEECVEARPTSSEFYCGVNDANHGVSCWSVIIMCRRSCRATTPPSPRPQPTAQPGISSPTLSPEPSPTRLPTSSPTALPTLSPTLSPTPVLTTASTTAPQLCSLEGSDRYNPDRNGCCSGLEECTEARSTSSEFYCGADDVNHGVTCWSKILICRSSCAGATTASPTPALTASLPATPEPPSHSLCVQGDYVPCCPDGSCNGYCQGDQCCPSANGMHSTCPSASVDHLPFCQLKKPYDCTSQ